MKIEVNYDLFSKIIEAKHGFSLNTRKILLQTSFASLLNLAGGMDISDTLNYIPFYLTAFPVSENLFKLPLLSIYKKNANDDLKKLVQYLRDINVFTDYELLSKSYVYKTDYKVKINQHMIPYLKQDKYIMVPTYDNKEDNEVSLVQEHIVGSKKYFLSYGTPKKVLKLAFNPI